MLDQHFTSSWYNQTTLHPLGLAAILILGIAMFLVPRRMAIVPILIAACFIAPAQRIVIFTLDFHLLRVMITFGWLRVLCHSEFRKFRPGALDIAVVAWSVWSALALIACHGTLPALINRMGFMLDSVGAYFLFRCLVRNWRDMRTTCAAIAWLSIPVAAVFLVEKSSGRNAFAIFGGVPEVTLVRAGKLRCTGAFAHPILAGSFWAALMPLIGLLWAQRGLSRWLAPSGLACALIIILTCASSTPVIALGAVIAAAVIFRIRAWTPVLRAGAVVGLILAQLAMQNPLWHILTRINVMEGSTGHHRYLLVDEFMKRIDEWWATGTISTVDWSVTGLGDVTNQYVLEGVHGGLGGLLLFLGLITVAFMMVSRTCRQADASRDPVDQQKLRVAWALGAAVAVHCVVFVGTSYFGQITIVWYMTLAMVGSLAAPLPRFAWRTASLVARPRRSRSSTLQLIGLHRTTISAQNPSV